MRVAAPIAGPWRSALPALLLAALSVAWSTPAATLAPSIPPEVHWLTTVNSYRAMAGLAPVVEDPALSAAASQHSNYMLFNDITHDEDPAKAGYTPEGDAAGNSGNVAVSSAVDATSRSFVELWMTGPFHAVGILRPNLRTVGFGQASRADTAKWHAAATLDVLHGLAPRTPLDRPVLFPGDGTTTNLTKFVIETPDPLAFCGWTAPAGLPTMALLPEPTSGTVLGGIASATGPLDTCVLTADNTTGTASAILRGNNVVVVIPHHPLAAGAYTETVTTGSRTVTWTFTVDPAAALGTPAPTAVPAAAGGYASVTPIRMVDTRIGIGSARLRAGRPQRIQITGTGMVPAGATAVDANFTVAGATQPGFLTAWNGTAERPVVSTVNYRPGEIVPNDASVPLDASGGLTVVALTDVELVVDVCGYYGAGASGRFHAVTPARLFDSRLAPGAAAHVASGTTVRLQVIGVGGIPSNATAVALNVTSADVQSAGFVTLYSSDRPRPFTANLNPEPGEIRPNSMVTEIAADGTISIYSSSAIDLIVDVTGYVAPQGSASFTATVPFRFTDTRDADRAELNAGLGGSELGAGQVLRIQIAGRRGVPATATAVSVNIAVTNAEEAGFVTAWPGGERPNTAAVNYVAGTPSSNGAVLALSPTGELLIYTMSTADVIVDVNGWWG